MKEYSNSISRLLEIKRIFFVVFVSILLYLILVPKVVHAWGTGQTGGTNSGPAIYSLVTSAGNTIYYGCNTQLQELNSAGMPAYDPTLDNGWNDATGYHYRIWSFALNGFGWGDYNPDLQGAFASGKPSTNNWNNTSTSADANAYYSLDVDSWKCNGIPWNNMNPLNPASSGNVSLNNDLVDPTTQMTDTYNSTSNVLPIDLQLGTPNTVPGCNGACPGAWLNDSLGQTKNPANDVPPVFMANHGSAGAFADDNGRALIADQSLGNSAGQTVWCQAFNFTTDVPFTAANQLCPPGILSSTYGSFGTGQRGAGWLITSADCMLLNPLINGGNNAPDSNSISCGTAGVFGWQKLISGKSNTSLTGAGGPIQNYPYNAIKPFYFHASSINSYTGGWGAVTYTTARYPILGLNASQNCAAQTITINYQMPNDVSPTSLNVYANSTAFPASPYIIGPGNGSLTLSMAWYGDGYAPITANMSIDGTTVNISPAFSFNCITLTCPASPPTFYIDPNGESAISLSIAVGNHISQPTDGINVQMPAGFGYIPNLPSPYSGNLTTSGLMTAPAVAAGSSYTINYQYILNGSIQNPPNCTAIIIVQNEPYLKVYGGDVEAGGGFSSSNFSYTSPNTCSSPLAQYNVGGAVVGGGIIGWNYGYGASPSQFVNSGSGTELGALALGYIYNFTSNGGTLQQGSSGTNYNGNALTFANTITNASGNVYTYGGALGNAPCINDYWTEYYNSGLVAPTTILTSTVSIDSLASGTYYYNGNLTVNTGNSGANLLTNQQITLLVKGNVYINTNIKTSNAGYTNDANGNPIIPEFNLVVESGNIFIDSGVGQLDGLYVAEPTSTPNPTDGSIYDCVDSTAFTSGVMNLNAFNAGNCDNTKLIIEGSFVANQVDFMRSKGTLGSSVGQPFGKCTSQDANAAEIFCYNPEVWLAPSPITNSNFCQGQQCDSNPPAIIYSLPPTS